VTWEESNKRIDDEYAWFDANRDTVMNGHHGELAAIRDHKVWGYFTKLVDADAFMHDKGFADGDFAVQVCLTQKEESDMVTPAYLQVQGNLAYA
jgi:hypothetical protein